MHDYCGDQRIYISDRRDSTRHCLTKIWLTQPLPACSVGWAGSAIYCRQSGERLGDSNLCKTMAGAVFVGGDPQKASQCIPLSGLHLRISTCVTLVLVYDTPWLGGEGGGGGAGVFLLTLFSAGELRFVILCCINDCQFTAWTIWRFILYPCVNNELL